VGESQRDHAAAKRNRILASLPAGVFKRLISDATFEDAAQRLPLYKRDQPIRHIFFVLAGVASIVSSDDRSGNVVEVATVGREGMVGLPIFLGSITTSLDCLMQVPGRLLRMRTKDFRVHINGGSELMNVMHRYTQALMTQMAQSSACNRMHSVQERCARWLLMTHDRVDADEFALTQEFLGQMIGVRRASVSATASALQEQGLIRHSRGSIAILDRAGLEAASCECYEIVEKEYDRLLNGPRGR
jgi:CRP-like cAMP-binding protein